MRAWQCGSLILLNGLLVMGAGCSTSKEGNLPPKKNDGQQAESKGTPKGQPGAKPAGNGSEQLPAVLDHGLEVKTPQGHRVKVAAKHDPWADAVVSFKPGNPGPRRSKDPRAALGKPDYKGTDDAADEKTFVALGHGGELVLEFRDNVLIDGPGPDLVIFEIGPAVEPVDVAISEDGKKWINVGRAEGAKSTLDIGPYVRPGQRFRFVKLTDAKAGLSNDSDWPGADIDAVGAINSLPVSK
jgi:hypothetical protein